MKHIQKQLSNEPKPLIEYRNTTPNPTYDGAPKSDIRKVLLEEQGGLCAYCMNRISDEYIANEAGRGGKPKMEIEHFKPQEAYPRLSLKYGNMLGVCNGSSYTHPEDRHFLHCDKTAGTEGKVNGTVELRRLNPLRKQDSEDLLSYRLNGRVYARSALEDVTHDLEEVLNLNNPVLVKQRKAILDVAKNELIRDESIQKWNTTLFEKHINRWTARYKNNSFRKFCMVAIDFLEKLKQKPKYQN